MEKQQNQREIIADNLSSHLQELQQLLQENAQRTKERGGMSTEQLGAVAVALEHLIQLIKNSHMFAKQLPEEVFAALKILGNAGGNPELIKAKRGEFTDTTIERVRVTLGL